MSPASILVNQKLYVLSQYKDINIKIDHFLVAGEICDKDFVLSETAAFAFLLYNVLTTLTGWHIFTGMGVLLDRFIPHCLM